MHRTILAFGTDSGSPPRSIVSRLQLFGLLRPATHSMHFFENLTAEHLGLDKGLSCFRSSLVEWTSMHYLQMELEHVGFSACVFLRPEEDEHRRILPGGR